MDRPPLSLPWKASLKSRIATLNYRSIQQAKHRRAGKGAGTRMAMAFAKKVWK